MRIGPHSRAFARWSARMVPAALAACLAWAPAAAFETNPFADAPVAAEGELAAQRGGFLVAGGLILNFAIDMTTLVNGTTASQLTLTSAAGETFDASALQRIIQIGAGNTLSADAFQAVTSALTVIQNTVPGTVIQHFTSLTLDVQNYAPYQAEVMQSLTGQMIRNLP